MSELSRLLHSRKWLFFVKVTGTNCFCQLSNPFLRNKGGCDQILSDTASEAINAVLCFLKTSQIFSHFQHFPIRQTTFTSSKPLPHNWHESRHHISHNQADKRIANAALVNQEYAAGNTQCAWDWLQRTLQWFGTNIGPEKYTPWSHFHVHCSKNQIQFQISVKAALVGLLH